MSVRPVLVGATTPGHLPIYDSSTARPSWWSETADLWRYRDLLVQLVTRDIKVRYKRSVLGVAWTMLNPLLMMVVFTLAFSQIFQVDSPNYPVFLLSATLAWGFFSQTSTVGLHQLLGSGPLVTRIYVPRTVFAVSAMLVGLVNFVISLVPLTALMLVTGAPLTPALAVLPISIVALAAFTLGVTLILSTFAIRFHDTVDLYQVALSAWFFLTPIVYPPTLISQQRAWQTALNPMSYYVALFRDPIYAGRVPDPATLLIAIAIAATTLIAGWVGFTTRAHELAYRL